MRTRAELRCRRAGGSIAFPIEMVDSFQKGTLTRKTSAPASGGGMSTDMPVRGEPVTPLRGGLLSREEATARLDRLERILAGPGHDTSQDRKEAGILHAYLAGLDVEQGDMEGADLHYRESLRHTPGLLPARLNHGALQIQRKRYGEARTILQDVLADQPTSSRALYLLGEASMQEGRYAEAIELWTKSLDLKPDPDVRERLERARRLHEAEQGFLSTDAPHFALKFDGDQASPDLARDILEFLEQSHRDLSERFVQIPDGPIRVTLYSRESFHKATDSPDWVGGLFDGELRIPIGGVTTLTAGVRRVLIHELAHCFIASRSAGFAPSWVQEGYAQRIEGRNGTRDRGRLRTACSALGAEACVDEIPYPAALSLMEFFMERWTQADFNEMLDHLARGGDIDTSLRGSIGLSHAEFLGAWQEWLSRP